jgi:hypothetical protein
LLLSSAAHTAAFCSLPVVLPAEAAAKTPLGEEIRGRAGGAEARAR